LPRNQLPKAYRGYDADWLCGTLKDKGIEPCIPRRKAPKPIVRYDNRRYKRRKRIAIMFGGLRDWRRAETGCDRRPKVFSTPPSHSP